MTAAPRFSVVICSDGRLAHLRATLAGLLYSTYQNFEVCVVCGPSDDGTRAYVAQYGRGLKFARCESRNLSMARNIGIAMSAGDIVAFLDDDAIPEPEWLQQLAQSYTDPEFAAAGGWAYDDSGLTFQTRYVTIDRLGYANPHWSTPAPHLNFPYSPEFPHLLGANCSFRRSVLL
jgi:glycogen(starch) synthase